VTDVVGCRVEARLHRVARVVHAAAEDLQAVDRVVDPQAEEREDDDGDDGCRVADRGVRATHWNVRIEAHGR
jgi:hypothetical protein